MTISLVWGNYLTISGTSLLSTIQRHYLHSKDQWYKDSRAQNLTNPQAQPKSLDIRWLLWVSERQHKMCPHSKRQERCLFHQGKDFRCSSRKLLKNTWIRRTEHILFSDHLQSVPSCQLPSHMGYVKTYPNISQKRNTVPLCTEVEKLHQCLKCIFRIWSIVLSQNLQFLNEWKWFYQL